MGHMWKESEREVLATAVADSALLRSQMIDTGDGDPAYWKAVGLLVSQKINSTVTGEACRRQDFQMRKNAGRTVKRQRNKDTVIDSVTVTTAKAPAEEHKQGSLDLSIGSPASNIKELMRDVKELLRLATALCGRFEIR